MSKHSLEPVDVNKDNSFLIWQPQLNNFLTQILQHISLNTGWIFGRPAYVRCSIGRRDYLPGLFQYCLRVAAVPEVQGLPPCGECNCGLAPEKRPALGCHAGPDTLTMTLHIDA